MAEFRYQGTSAAGRVVQGTLIARNRKEARERIDDLCRRRHLRLITLHQKQAFLWKAHRADGKKVSGEQRAFCKEEVENGLRRLGFKPLRVERKLLDIRFRPPSRDIVLFIRMCADLLREHCPYDEILRLLVNDTENRVLANAIREIQQDLKEGRDGQAVFGKQADVLGRFAAYMLGVASTSGNMVEVYEATAKFLERTEEFKKSLRSALVMPSVVMLALFAAIVYYVGFIFPQMAGMFARMNVELPAMTQATLEISRYLQDNLFWLTPLSLAPFIGTWLYFRSDRGRILRDRLLIRIPVVGTLLHKTSIEIFARVFSALYSGSGENITVIRIAAEACRNAHIEKRIKDVAIPKMLQEGRGLVESLIEADVFTPTAIARLRTGQESGTLKAASEQLADYYERESIYKMKAVVELVHLIVSMVIMVVLTALTLVSSETALIKPKNPVIR